MFMIMTITMFMIMTITMTIVNAVTQRIIPTPLTITTITKPLYHRDTGCKISSSYAIAPASSRLANVAHAV